MFLLIEEYQYAAKDVEEVLDGLFTLQDVEHRISVSYVGYYYNPKIKDCVFILPKVLIDEKGLVFGKYNPASVIHLDEAEMAPHELKFIYEFAVWIHRAIVVFNQTHAGNSIVHFRQIESEGHGSKKRSNTLLDVILSLLRFAKENRSFFTFVLKNIHSGFNKINWNKTISSTTAIVENASPVYLNPVNKKRQINFDEELIVIFFSILHYVADHFGFKTEIPFGFKLITGSKFERYINGFGRRRLRQIKYKYFSDTAKRLWDLCYAFFDKAYQIKVSTSQSEYLLVKSFHIVFEAIIDELIGDHDVPAGLKEQADGKLVDHFYTYRGLLSNHNNENDIYYIGDSKYYKIGRNPGEESVYKQYTYARNVIQWNLNLFDDAEEKDKKRRIEKIADKGRYGSIRLRDDEMEGYNVIPNFFISAAIDPVSLSYKDHTVQHSQKVHMNRHFPNRLYDRDTLLISHYDVNFLFVVALYARDNKGAKEAWKTEVRRKFRQSVQRMLSESFTFYAMAAKPGVDIRKYFETHFQEMLGKTLSPFDDKRIVSLALDSAEMYREGNEQLLAKLSESFEVVECRLGEDPRDRLQATLDAAERAQVLCKMRNAGRNRVLVVSRNEMAMHLGNQLRSESFVASPKLALRMLLTPNGIDILSHAGEVGAVVFHDPADGYSSGFLLKSPMRFERSGSLNQTEDYYGVFGAEAETLRPDTLFALLELDLDSPLPPEHCKLPKSATIPYDLELIWYR